MIKIKVKKLHKDAVIPSYKHIGDSGMDLHILLDMPETILHPNEPAIFNTGLAFELPYMVELQARPRSGLACKFGVTLTNSPGTVDSFYQGEVMVGLINLSNEPYKLKNGDRVAQIVPCLVPVMELIDADEFGEETKRGGDGFGSTGR